MSIIETVSGPDLDPRWEWAEMSAWGEERTLHVKVACRHLETEPVDTLGGEVVAQLCLTCDSQLPAPGSAAG